MITVLLPKGPHAQGDTIELDDEESRHLQVRRAQDDIACIGLDGLGTVVTGTVRRGAKRWELAADVVRHVPPHAATTLAVGAGDRDRFLWIVEKCAELHVTRIIPLVTARQRNVENRLRDVGIERAQRRAREACKQSGNPWFPEIADLTPLDALDPSHPWLLASASGDLCPALAHDQAAAWIVGPEGGLTDDELTWITRTLDSTPVSLGPAVMRFETAAIAAAVVTHDRRTQSP